MQRKRDRRLIFLPAVLFVLLSLSGCPRVMTRAPERLDEFSVIEPAERAKISEELSKTAASIRTFKGLASIVIEHFPSKDRGRQAILFSRPSELRLETFEPAVNRLVSLVTVNDGSLRAVVTREKRAYVGEASPEILERFVYLPLQPDAVMLLLVGRLNPDELPAIDSKGHSADSVQWRKSPTGDSYLLYAPLRSGALTIEAVMRVSGGKQLGAKESELMLQELLLYERATRKLRVKVVYSYPEPPPIAGSGAILPQTVRVELPQKHVVVELAFTETKINQTIPAERFGLAIPAGLEVVQLLRE